MTTSHPQSMSPHSAINFGEGGGGGGVYVFFFFVFFCLYVCNLQCNIPSTKISLHSKFLLRNTQLEQYVSSFVFFVFVYRKMERMDEALIEIDILEFVCNNICMYVYIYVCMYIYMYVYMYVYIPFPKSL